MKAKAKSFGSCCTNSRNGKSGSYSILAGALGGIVGVAAVAILAAFLVRRAFPRLMPRMMERMMRNCDCPPEMRACLEKCGCGSPTPEEAPPA